MSSLLTLNGQIKNSRSRVFRRLLIKRRNQGSGTYESLWLDITKDVQKWGSIKKSIDSNKVNQFNFSNITLTMSNESGRYNPSEDDNSLWYGFGSQQRTLIKIITGFIYETQDAGGVWTPTAINAGASWNDAKWDPNSSASDAATTYSGFISGDINITGDNKVNLPIVPLQQCFRQYAASRLTGYNTSLTASDFITLLRDQVDSSGAYIFRPFFGNTTTNWQITSTSVEYANLNTSTAEDLTNLTVWDVIQKLAEAENFVPYVTSGGVFKFFSRNENTAAVFELFGGQSFSSQWGQTIKKITWFGQRWNKYYSRVTVKWQKADTTTSYETKDSQYLVRGDSGPWTLGEKTLSIQNTWIPSATVANNIATNLFNEFSALREEVDFSTTFIPHLDVLDRVLLTYDQSPVTNNSLWDVYNWGDTTSAIDFTDLLWDNSPGDPIRFFQTEFRLISVDINLDSFECKYTGRRS